MGRPHTAANSWRWGQNPAGMCRKLGEEIDSCRRQPHIAPVLRDAVGRPVNPPDRTDDDNVAVTARGRRARSRPRLRASNSPMLKGFST